MKPEVFHEFDWEGNHRVRVVAGGVEVCGDWECYSHPATVEAGDRLFTAYTDYFEEKVVESSIPRTVKSKVQAICDKCGTPFSYDSNGDIKIGCEHIKKRAATYKRTITNLGI